MTTTKMTRVRLLVNLHHIRLLIARVQRKKLHKQRASVAAQMEPGFTHWQALAENVNLLSASEMLDEEDEDEGKPFIIKLRKRS